METFNASTTAMAAASMRSPVHHATAAAATRRSVMTLRN
jgi:hypothetical protein